MSKEDQELEKLYTSYLEKQLRLDAQGTWHHDDTPFSHKRLSELFHRSVLWDDELKDYVIRIGKGRATFSHEGRVRFITSLREEDGKLFARTAGGSEEELNPADLRLTEEEEFVVFSENSPLTYFTRTAQQQILSHAESERALEIGGNLYTVPFLEDEG